MPDGAWRASRLKDFSVPFGLFTKFLATKTPSQARSLSRSFSRSFTHTPSVQVRLVERLGREVQNVARDGTRQGNLVQKCRPTVSSKVDCGIMCETKRRGATRLGSARLGSAQRGSGTTRRQFVARDCDGRRCSRIPRRDHHLSARFRTANLPLDANILKVERTELTRTMSTATKINSDFDLK